MYNFKINLVMSTFRKRPLYFRAPAAPPIIIRAVEEVEDVVDGVPVQHEVLVSLTPSEYLERFPPVQEDYTLLQQLQAGVSVKEVASSTLLDSPDNLDYDENEGAEDKILSELEKEVDKIDE